MDVRNIPLAVVVKTTQLADLSMENQPDGQIQTDPNARGILVPQTAINFFKNSNLPIKLTGSISRAPANAIISLDFKFEDMGIGGLDKEFSTIFRRALSSDCWICCPKRKKSFSYLKRSSASTFINMQATK